MAQYKQTYYNYKETNHKKLKPDPKNQNKRYKYFQSNSLHSW